MRIFSPWEWIVNEALWPFGQRPRLYEKQVLADSDTGKNDSPDDALPCRLMANGTFVVFDGNHRASWRRHNGEAGLWLDVQQVNPAWLRMCDDLRSIYGNESIYEPIDHPWFAAWDQRRDPGRIKCVEAVIAGHWSRGSIGPWSVGVDLGCCTGAVTRAMARHGLRAVGVDCDARVLGIAGQLAAAVFGTSVHYIECDVRANFQNRQEYSLDGQWMWWTKIEVLTVLSLLHHWLESGVEESAAFLQWMRKLGTKLIILDVPAPGESWVLDAAKLTSDGIEAAWREALHPMAGDLIGVHDGRRMLAFRGQDAV